MKKMKKLLLILLPLLAIFMVAQKSFDSWKNEQKTQYSRYISKQDREFSEFLKKNWTEFQAFAAAKQDSVPKPEKSPIFIPKEKRTPKKNESALKKKSVFQKETLTTDKNKVNIKLPQKPKINKIESHNSIEKFEATGEKLEFKFWGFPLAITKANIKVDSAKAINKDFIANFWYKSSIIKHKQILEDLKHFREKLKLNDWGYCLMLHNYSQKIFSNNRNNQYLFDWFLLIKSGYNVKVGFNDNKVVLLMPSKDTIYGYPYINQNGKNFYLIDFESKNAKRISVYTYDGSYPNADDILDFGMKENPKLKSVIIKKELKFTYKDSLYTIPVEFDKNISEFLNQFPNTDLSVYFNSTLGPAAKYSIAKAFKPILEGKSQTESANILLRFMQTAFKYETDQQQFGYEKPFYPEETLFYPYSDCEDRAILFSYLVRELLGLEVVGLDYPGHISTAVKFNSSISGDIVKIKGEDYLICDPTYINADIGIEMPKFKNIRPKIIEVTSYKVGE